MEKPFLATGWSTSGMLALEDDSAAPALQRYVLTWDAWKAQSLAEVGGLSRVQQKAQPCQKETLPVSESLKTEVLQLLREKVPESSTKGKPPTRFLRLHFFSEPTKPF